MTEWIRCYAREHLGVELPRPWVFLAGPTPRDTETASWRPHMLEAFDERTKLLYIGGTLIVPENREFESFDAETMMDDQVAWEWKGLELADAILFWVPRNMETLPGMTTNIEFGMYWDSGKVVVGWPEGAENNGYFVRLAERGDIKVCNEMRWAAYHTSLLAEDNYTRGYAL